MKIDINKKYMTKSGRKVRILATNIKDTNWPVAAAVRWFGDHDAEDLYSYSAEGLFHLGSSHEHDLVEVPVWHDFKVDQPVLVRNKDGSWVKRYWARAVDDKPTTWANGATSWSVDGPDSITPWDECKEAAYIGPQVVTEA